MTTKKLESDIDAMEEISSTTKGFSKNRKRKFTSSYLDDSVPSKLNKSSISNSTMALKKGIGKTFK